MSNSQYVSNSEDFDLESFLSSLELEEVTLDDCFDGLSEDI